MKCRAVFKPLAVSISLLVALTGCQSTNKTYGVREDVWQMLTLEQKQQLIARHEASENTFSRKVSTVDRQAHKKGRYATNDYQDGPPLFTFKVAHDITSKDGSVELSNTTAKQTEQRSNITAHTQSEAIAEKKSNREKIPSTPMKTKFKLGGAELPG